MSIFANNTGESSTIVGNFAEVLERTVNPAGDHPLRVPFYMTSTLRKKFKKK